MFGDITTQKVTDVFIKVLKRELIYQGHNLTGQLDKSIAQILTSNQRKQFSEIVAEEYIVQLDQGVPAKQIPQNEAYILQMVEYAKKRLGASHRFLDRACACA
jgi:hypothetical protein